VSYAADGPLDPPEAPDYECDCDGACGDDCDEDCYCPGHTDECGMCNCLPCRCDDMYQSWKDED